MALGGWYISFSRLARLTARTVFCSTDYRDTAAKLQKEWRVQAPHRKFDFAKHVHTYALVSLLNKGLIYEDYQRKFAEANQDTREGQAAAESARGVFGPLKFEPAPNESVEDMEEEDESEAETEIENGNARKRGSERPHHVLRNGTPAKRQRLSNGNENGNGAESATTPMEIDSHADNSSSSSNNNNNNNNNNNSSSSNVNNNHAYPSPLEGEQAASPPPRTEGPEKGTQTEEPLDLTPATVFLRMGADESTESELSTSQDQMAENPIASPLALFCEWNPSNPSILAVAGTEALARLWTLSRGDAPVADIPAGHVDDRTAPPFTLNSSFSSLTEQDVLKSSTVSSLAWNADGTAIALAVDHGGKSRVSIWDVNGSPIHRFDGVDPPVIKLRWSPNKDLILGVSLDSRGIMVTVFSLSTANSVSHLLERTLDDSVLDVCWVSETEFVICGGDCLVALRCEEKGIEPGREFDTDKDESFSQIKYDAKTGLIATATEKGVIHIWDQAGQRRSISAHIGNITGLLWQPLDREPEEDERLLASSGEDGAICIWNVRNADNKAKYSMTMADQIASIAMTPDGTYIAGATADRVLVWKLDDPTVPYASWNKESHPGWRSPKTGAEADEILAPCLGWDAEGGKLVYGLNSRLAVINFR
ncbi:hypothetical protein NEUTE1DRAFT_123216 [Neurospora tetrasperma FGSC 2508]|uniref:Uncharacterized protein n=1 Tax=Neurospora tetrasperma (strain FGSC 2508 / ATCC MYA-4615 / P0657) TaxID=510951 RepID=F8MQW4_NEUT8|nr:uncharacterized protein NEUTE1DRAFT_123216 [Neurospora tetrasperma FGSC 2508]EGO56744.1 hypothetical protein NEUTE1DRAFT_123216 [Neurospora tetrasperma FGSC 2508]EGZ70374.1 WD40 repeat-like protein [Neurospora tetrasperma FGSC 2509]